MGNYNVFSVWNHVADVSFSHCYQNLCVSPIGADIYFLTTYSMLDVLVHVFKRARARSPPTLSVLNAQLA